MNMSNESEVPLTVPNVEKAVPEPSPYDATVEGLVTDARRFNQTQLMHYVNDTLIESILSDAESGAITTKRMNETTGDSETVTLGVTDIMEQFTLALQAKEMIPDNPKMWINYISRSNGLRTAAKTMMSNDLLSEPFRLAVYKRQADLLRGAYGANEHEQASTVEIQRLREHAVEDLGDEAVEASGIAEPSLTEASRAAQRLFSSEPGAVEAERKDPLGYLREVFPPLTRPSITPRPHAFGQYKAPTKEESALKYYDTYVTAENKEASLSLMSEVIKTTPALLDVLQKSGLEATSLDAVDAIRENADVRFEVAKILLTKLNTLAEQPHTDLGWRVVDNSMNNLKSDPVTGKKFYSREYAVSVALKMLGGEFSGRREENDFDRDESGKVISGQHRHAARQALMTY